MLTVDPHPLLHAVAFTIALPRPLGDMGVQTTPDGPEAMTDLLRSGAPPFPPADDTLRGAVRDMLRHGGYKPTGRGKPASEYLLKAVEGGTLGAINLLVDACNVASLHSGFPISVVDLARARGPFRVGIAETGAAYVFNAAGQTIDLGGLLCLHDTEGPCANAVKDSQRTKTHAGTRDALAVVWGARAHVERTVATARWYRALLDTAGAVTTPMPTGD
jgi:DNA/RNA-binding domain of Phe-tRNA-synthetase-like protein